MMGSACGTCGGEYIYIRGLVSNPEGLRTLGRHTVNGKMISKSIFKKHDGRGVV
jgi:hypothetical protein